MRIGRKLSSKNCRAAVLPRGPVLTARAHTVCNAARTGLPSFKGFERTIGRQLAWKVANALAWSSPLQPSSSPQPVGSSAASGILKGSGAERGRTRLVEATSGSAT